MNTATVQLRINLNGSLFKTDTLWCHMTARAMLVSNLKSQVNHSQCIEHLVCITADILGECVYILYSTMLRFSHPQILHAIYKAL